MPSKCVALPQYMESQYIGTPSASETPCIENKMHFSKQDTRQVTYLATVRQVTYLATVRQVTYLATVRQVTYLATVRQVTYLATVRQVTYLATVRQVTYLATVTYLGNGNSKSYYHHFLSM